jgi:hypothetical protein
MNKNFKAKNGIETPGQVVSTVATGTAPLVVSSTTKVDNLNADTLDGYHAADLMTTASSIADSFRRARCGGLLY